MWRCGDDCPQLPLLKMKKLATFSTADSSESRPQAARRTAAAESTVKVTPGTPLSEFDPAQSSPLRLAAKQSRRAKTPIHLKEQRLPIRNRYTGSIKPRETIRHSMSVRLQEEGGGRKHVSRARARQITLRFPPPLLLVHLEQRVRALAELISAPHICGASQLCSHSPRDRQTNASPPPCER